MRRVELTSYPLRTNLPRKTSFPRKANIRRRIRGSSRRPVRRTAMHMGGPTNSFPTGSPGVMGEGGAVPGVGVGTAPRGLLVQAEWDEWCARLLRTHVSHREAFGRLGFDKASAAPPNSGTESVGRQLASRCQAAYPILPAPVAERSGCKGASRPSPGPESGNERRHE